MSNKFNCLLFRIQIEKLFQGGEEGQKRAQLEALTIQFDGLLKDRSVAAEGIMP